jgi:tyrosine-protein kinase Etk/Wzc
LRHNRAFVDIVANWNWFQRPWLRRFIFGLAIFVTLLLAIFPLKYVGNVKLAPQDTSTAGLSSVLSQLGGNYAALLGGHQPVEIDLAIGRSFDVQQDVARRTGLLHGNDPAEVKRAVQEMEKRATVRALRAGILEIEVEGHDPDLTLRTAAAFASAMQDRLAALSRQQTAYKRRVLDERMQQATERLTRAEDAVTRFRQENKLIAPETQLSDAVAQQSRLRAQYQAVQVELAKAVRFAGEDSVQVKSIRTALGAIQAQVRDADLAARRGTGMSAAGIAPKALEFQRLNRELQFAQALYESYTRYLEGAAIENLTADFNMQIIEPAFLEPGVKFNAVPLALLVLLVLLAIGSEFFVFRPPPGRSFP